MSNNINNNHESVENIFNAFLMGGKMNTASKQERAKIVDTFIEQAKSCFVDTENTVKYLNVLMERTRLRYGFTADEFAACWDTAALPLTTRHSCNQMQILEL